MFTRILLLCVALAVGRALSALDDQEGDLFTRHFSVTAPIFRTNIPAETCRDLVAQADQITTKSAEAGGRGSAGLKPYDNSRLQIAGENLRSCATNDSLSRRDRDLAVGLYAWISIEQNRREQFQSKRPVVDVWTSS